MEFFCYHCDRPGSTPLRERMVEQHWAYMDGSAETMIVCGPLLSDDRSTAVGVAALLEASGPDEARAALGAGEFAAVEVPAWQFGGRPD